MEDRDDALNSLRIRQTASLRRALYRMRSYAIIAAGVSAVAALQLLALGARRITVVGIDGKSLAYFLLAIPCCALVIYFIRRALELDRQARQSTQIQPAEPPDFSALGDGGNIQEKFDRIE